MEIKRALVFLGSTVFAVIFLAGVVEAVDKFAYVDVARIASEYTKAKEYSKKLEDKATAYETDMNKRVEEVKQLQDKINLLSDKEKDAKKTELETKIKDLQEYRRQKETDLRKEDFDNTKEIVESIKGAIKDYAEKQGFTLVFDDRALVYETKSMEITDKIIEDLNKKAVSTAPAAATTKK